MIVVYILSFVVAIISYSVMNLNDDPIFLGNEETWWGPDELRGANNTSIRPYKVVFSDKMINDLKHRLNNCRMSKSTPFDVKFQYGFNTRQVPVWAHYWANEYPFRSRENYLNQFPHFKTNVQGLDIHFIRVKPKVPARVKVVPLLLLHGWPGSVREFYGAIPLLTAYCSKRGFAVEVIVPSLPGFGFSDAPVISGLGADGMAVVMRNLMLRLGFKKYYIQGGDWGSFIGANMATMFPKEVLGYHSNMAFVFTRRGLMMHALGEIMPSLVVPSNLFNRMYPLIDKLNGIMEEFGYFHMQSTKPESLGIAHSDSPVGLLAHIGQMFSMATRYYYKNRLDGGLDHYPKETFIDNLMVYWSTNSITSAMRIYAETINKKFTTHIREAPTAVPTWVIQPLYEIAYQSPSILKTKFTNLLHATLVEDKGHFLALEDPKLFSEDVLKALGEFIKWHSKK